MIKSIAPILAALLAQAAWGQIVPRPLEPAIPRPELPPFEHPAPVPFALPPLAPTPDEPARLAPELKIFIRQIEISGNTVVPSEELARIALAYEGRTLTSADLLELRNKLTLHYVNKGYINSGAVLPDQEVKHGIVRFSIVEGTLTEIELAGNERLRPNYVLERIRLRAQSPLNINQLQEGLQLLQQSGLIQRVNAELLPGTAPGESRLRVTMHEARPYQLGISFANDRPPSIGPYRTEIFGIHRNLLGFGDTIDVRRGVTRGLEDYSLSYSIPVSARDTLLTFRGTRDDSAVIEVPFDAIDISSRSSNVAIGLSQPLAKDVFGSFVLGLGFEKRKNTTALLGEPFSFYPGIPDGESKVDVLRLSQDWLRRDASRVIALRSTFSSGKTNAVPQTRQIGPDRRFLAWLGQFQWAQLDLASGAQLVARAYGQWSNNPLMPIEKLAFGGVNTVRGYRENQVLRDRAYILSAEYRHQVYSEKTGGMRLYVAPFADYGRGWNADASPAKPDSLASAGLGFLFEHGQRFQARLYLARPFRNIPQIKHDPQDSGIHFALAYQHF